MHHDRRFRRATGALIAAVLAASLIALPAIAADPTPRSPTRTLWVDDDGAAGPSGCGGTRKAPGSIQRAVNLAEPGTTILVCPGTYRERVNVRTDGLTIRGTQPWKALLRPPDAAGSNQSLLSISGARAVTVQWLKLLAPAEPGECRSPNTMIWVTRGSADAVIRANRIRPTHEVREAYLCGFAGGIVVDRGSSAWVGYNLVQDFRYVTGGIIVHGAGTAVTVVHNIVRSRHTSVTPSESWDPGESWGHGILVSGGANALVGRNAIVGLSSAGTTTPRLLYGIRLFSAGHGTIVRRNLVRFAEIGIQVFGTKGARVLRNVLLDGEFGISIKPDATRNRLVGNTALRNDQFDCFDGSTGATGTNGTQNKWVGNGGIISSPADLCTRPAP